MLAVVALTMLLSFSEGAKGMKMVFLTLTLF